MVLQCFWGVAGRFSFVPELELQSSVIAMGSWALAGSPRSAALAKWQLSRPGGRYDAMQKNTETLTRGRPWGRGTCPPGAPQRPRGSGASRRLRTWRAYGCVLPGAGGGFWRRGAQRGQREGFCCGQAAGVRWEGSGPRGETATARYMGQWPGKGLRWRRLIAAGSQIGGALTLSGDGCGCRAAGY